MLSHSKERVTSPKPLQTKTKTKSDKTPGQHGELDSLKRSTAASRGVRAT